MLDELNQLTLNPVLPAISTEGMGPDDVNALTESTREKMVATLRDISVPGPLGKTSLADVPPLEELSKDQQMGWASDEKRTGRPFADASGTGSRSGESHSGEESKGDSTTEDEMDEDAVLLKMPSES